MKRAAPALFFASLVACGSAPNLGGVACTCWGGEWRCIAPPCVPPGG